MSPAGTELSATSYDQAPESVIGQGLLRREISVNDNGVMQEISLGKGSEVWLGLVARK